MILSLHLSSNVTSKFQECILKGRKIRILWVTRPVRCIFAMRSPAFPLPCCVSGVGVVSMTVFSQFPGQLASGWVWAMEGADRMGRQRKEMTCIAFLSMGASSGGSNLFRLVYKTATSTQGPIFLFPATKSTVSVHPINPTS